MKARLSIMRESLRKKLWRLRTGYSNDYGTRIK